jgi:hypothetical protein
MTEPKKFTGVAAHLAGLKEGARVDLFLTGGAGFSGVRLKRVDHLNGAFIFDYEPTQSRYVIDADHVIAFKVQA